MPTFLPSQLLQTLCFCGTVDSPGIRFVLSTAGCRYPLIHDLRELYVLAYLGNRIDSSPFNQLEEATALV